MKKFFNEFKAFISRGNVIDLAVGVIIGGAFSAIVTALTNNILKPLINWIIYLVSGNADTMSIYTFLATAYTEEDGVKTIDLAKSIYIDWGAFLTAIINFLLIALILFVIVKIFNTVKANNEKLLAGIVSKKLTKEDIKELKSRGVKLTDKAGVEAYRAEKQAKADAEKEAKKKEEEEKAAAERLANPTAEDLLKDILAFLRSK
jgi:large conductance mechanosensitive channel